MILLIILATPICAFILSFFVKKRLSTYGVLAVGASLIEFVGTSIVVVSVALNGTYGFGEYLEVDALGAVIIMILALIGGVASLYSVGYLKVELAKKIIGLSRVQKYFIQLNLFIFAMYFATITTDPVLMWIAIEATTLSTAFLISFYNKPSSMDAAWKYLIINSVGLLLGFFGTLLFLSSAVHGGVEGLISWQTIRMHVSSLNPLLAQIAFAFVLVGFGTKVGLVPMHTWRPDAYSKAPTPIVTLLSGALLNVAFLAILRFKLVVDVVVGREFSGNLLIFFGLVSIVVSAFSIFVQKNYKRLLAYSSIEHAGIIAVGFGFGGIGAFAALLHMIYHSLAKSLLFLSAGNIFIKFGSKQIAQIKGLLKVLPITGILFIIGFLAATGMPPFGTFVTEFSIVSAGINTHPMSVALMLAAFALAFVGFLRHTSSMVFGESDGETKIGENGVITIIPLLILAVLLFLFSFFLPPIVTSLLNSAVHNY